VADTATPGCREQRSAAIRIAARIDRPEALDAALQLIED
jgi:hypothetical protein